jgi:hypothetical protein
MKPGGVWAPLKEVADQVASARGQVHVAVVDTLDERAVEEHAKSVVDQASGIDVSVNLSRGGRPGGGPASTLRCISLRNRGREAS